MPVIVQMLEDANYQVVPPMAGRHHQLAATSDGGGQQRSRSVEDRRALSPVAGFADAGWPAAAAWRDRRGTDDATVGAVLEAALRSWCLADVDEH